MDLEEAISINVLMQFSCQSLSAFSAYQGKFTGQKRKSCKKISSLEKGRILGDQGF